MSCSSSSKQSKKRKDPPAKLKEIPPPKKTRAQIFSENLDKHQASLVQLNTILKNNAFLQSVMRTILKETKITENCSTRLEQLIKTQGPVRKKDFFELKYRPAGTQTGDMLFTLFVNSIENNLDKVNRITLEYVEKHMMIMPSFIEAVAKCSDLTALHLIRVKLNIDHWIVLFESLMVLKDKIDDLHIEEQRYEDAICTVSHSSIGKTFPDFPTPGGYLDLSKYLCGRIDALQFFQFNYALKKLTLKTYGKPTRCPKDGYVLDTFFYLLNQSFLYLSRGCALEIFVLNTYSNGAVEAGLTQNILNTLSVCLHKNTLKKMNIHNMDFVDYNMIGNFWDAFKKNTSLVEFSYNEPVYSSFKLSVLNHPFADFQLKPNLVDLKLIFHDRTGSFSRSLLEYLIISQLNFTNLLIVNMHKHPVFTETHNAFLLGVFKILEQMCELKTLKIEITSGSMLTREMSKLSAVVESHPNITKLDMHGGYTWPRSDYYYYPNSEEKVDEFIKRNIANQQRKGQDLFALLWLKVFDPDRKVYRKMTPPKSSLKQLK